MIKLSEKELDLFLYRIKRDKKHFEKYVFLKLQYLYGRESNEIANLKANDINIYKNEITFNITTKNKKTQLKLPLLEDTVDDIKTILGETYTPIYDIQEETNEEASSFEECLDIICGSRDTGEKNPFVFIGIEENEENFKKNIRTFLKRNSEKLIMEIAGRKDISLTTDDFRKLRGQHLYLKGHDINTIQKLYNHTTTEQTINFLEINEIEIRKMLIKDQEEKNQHYFKQPMLGPFY